jgi:hypothetical protein
MVKGLSRVMEIINKMKPLGDGNGADDIFCDEVTEAIPQTLLLECFGIKRPGTLADEEKGFDIDLAYLKMIPILIDLSQDQIRLTNLDEDNNALVSDMLAQEYAEYVLVQAETEAQEEKDGEESALKPGGRKNKYEESTEDMEDRKRLRGLRGGLVSKTFGRTTPTLPPSKAADGSTGRRPLLYPQARPRMAPLVVPLVVPVVVIPLLLRNLLLH